MIMAMMMMMMMIITTTTTTTTTIIIKINDNDRTIRQSKFAIPKGVKNCGWLVITVLVDIITIIQKIKYHTYMHIFQLDEEVAN